MAPGAPRLGRWRERLTVEDPTSDILDLGQTRVGSDGARSGETEFGAVVLRRIMAAGQHHPGWDIEIVGREREEWRRHHADIEDVAPGLPQPGQERLMEHTNEAGQANK